MSTNFYLETKGEKIHIGKRSAAGNYCYACNETLCMAGKDGLHRSNNFHPFCPKCGTKNHVSPTCSFTWAIEPHKLGFVLSYDKASIILDEYDHPIPVDDFYPMLMNACRFFFYDSIGTEFC